VCPKERGAFKALAVSCWGGRKSRNNEKKHAPLLGIGHCEVLENCDKVILWRSGQKKIKRGEWSKIGGGTYVRVWGARREGIKTIRKRVRTSAMHWEGVKKKINGTRNDGDNKKKADRKEPG